MPRQKSDTYLPYEDAVKYIQSLNPRPKNRAEYIRWHKVTHCGFIPRYPNRVYTQWESWSLFLGTTNSFEQYKGSFGDKQKIVYRPFWEAVRYAQQAAKDHNLKTKDDWEEWYDSGMCPKDIPKRPYHAYTEFTGKGWPVWLGLKPEAKLVTAKQKVAVMAVCQTPGYPPNVVSIVVEGNGFSAFKDRWDGTIVGKPYRIYNWETDLIPYVEKIFAQHSFEKGNKMYLVPNMNALLFELDNILEFTIPPRELQRQFTV